MGSTTIKDLWDEAIKTGLTQRDITEKLAIFTIGYLDRLDEAERKSITIKIMEMLKLIMDDFSNREMNEEDLTEFFLLLDPDIKELYYEFFKELMKN